MDVHTGDSREAGEGASAFGLHTGHVGAAGLQSCEAVVVAVGRVHAESVKGAPVGVVQGHRGAVVDCWAVLHPGYQQRGESPGLELDRETHSVAWEEQEWSFSHTEK